MSRIDLSDKSFMDGSSYVQNGQQRVEYALTPEDKVVKARPLPQSWSAQWAKLWTLIWALKYATGKKVNIYTDSKYPTYA